MTEQHNPHATIRHGDPCSFIHHEGAERGGDYRADQGQIVTTVSRRSATCKRCDPANKNQQDYGVFGDRHILQVQEKDGRLYVSPSWYWTENEPRTEHEEEPMTPLRELWAWMKAHAAAGTLMLD